MARIPGKAVLEAEDAESVLFVYRFWGERVYFFFLISFFLLRRLIAPTDTVRSIVNTALFLYVPFFIYLQLGYFNILHLSKTKEKEKKGVVVRMVQLLFPASMRTVHAMEFRLAFVFLVYMVAGFTVGSLEPRRGRWVPEPDVVLALALFAGLYFGINKGIGFALRLYHPRRHYDHQYGCDEDDNNDNDCNDYLLHDKRRQPKSCPQRS
ncbi:unnamed protein product [Linum tenue]|uniref:Uncharacterized protein n=1 Tax=Linum tenue TaxID=586396 RepID=A0AAV0R4U6_9ROSI|nr:unnamed protein product [Linum tenue]